MGALDCTLFACLAALVGLALGYGGARLLDRSRLRGVHTRAEEITRTIHAHPTLPEALMQAAEAVYGHAIDA